MAIIMSDCNIPVLAGNSNVQTSTMAASISNAPSLPVPTLEESWEQLYEQLKAFRAMTGTCLVPGRYPENIFLGYWVGKQRRLYKDGKLSRERIAKLEAIGFKWVVTVSLGNMRRSNDFWDASFKHLKAYRALTGDCLVPYGYPENPSLAFWVSRQRKNYRKGILSRQRQARLDAIGFVWDATPKGLVGANVATGASNVSSESACKKGTSAASTIQPSVRTQEESQPASAVDTVMSDVDDDASHASVLFELVVLERNRAKRYKAKAATYRSQRDEHAQRAEKLALRLSKHRKLAIERIEELSNEVKLLNRGHPSRQNSI
ncbi:hypothetical protein MPSEU_000939600 [Mayamaea pseudoterrestris]|nr:hypothetical protein MPSEU_000939600 [Mayamaea pseudoterrestris]